MRRLFGIFKDDQGATAIEYALILAMVFLAMLGSVSLFGTRAIEMWDYISNEVQSTS